MTPPMADAAIEKCPFCGETMDHENDMGIFLCTPCGFSFDVVSTVAEAHAFLSRRPPLVSAAPDLLEACKRFCANVDRWLETGDPAGADESESIYDQAMAAIKKAGGADHIPAAGKKVE